MSGLANRRSDYATALSWLREVLVDAQSTRNDSTTVDIERALLTVLSLRSRRAQDILPARLEQLATGLRGEANALDAVWGPTLPVCVRLRERADEAMELARMVRAGVEP